MQRFQSPIPSAVSYPVTILFAPPKAAGGNLVVNVFLFLMTSVLTDWPPYIWFVTFIAGHALVVALAMKEPHMVPLAEARVQRSKWAKRSIAAATRNIVKSEGRKYVP